MQVGKVPPALPALRIDLGISLVTAGWVVSIFSLMAAFCAVFLGGIADRFGQMHTAIAGMLLCAAASVVGAYSETETAILVTRTIEGFGFIMTSVSIPALIARVANGANRRTALAMWGSYMPAGSGFMLLSAGPLLLYAGWQGVWIAAAIVILLVAFLLWLIRKDIPAPPEETETRLRLSDVFQVIRSPGPLLLSLIFTFYAGQYLAVAGFLPLMLVDLNGFRPESAAIVVAFIVLGNAVGNVSSGFLMSRGARPLYLILAGCLAMAVGEVAVFMDDSSETVRILGALLFSTFGGLIPSTLFSQVPVQAPSQRQFASVSGMLVQGAAIGQLLAPPICAFLISRNDHWNDAIPALLVAAVITAMSAVALARRPTPVT